MCALHKVLAADVALIGPLSCVASQVLPQVSTMGESPATVGAAERLLARVNPQVNLQIPFAAALFSADVTAMLHPGVDGHVFGQRGRAAVVFTTHLTTLAFTVCGQRL